MSMSDPSSAQGTEARRTLLALRAQRQHWVEVGPGRKVRYHRPRAAEMHRFLGGTVTIEHVCEYVDGWEGFTQATFLGDAVGASDPIEFDAELWSEYVRDQTEVASKVATDIAKRITETLAAREQAAKN